MTTRRRPPGAPGARSPVIEERVGRLAPGPAAALDGPRVSRWSPFCFCSLALAFSASWRASVVRRTGLASAFLPFSLALSGVFLTGCPVSARFASSSSIADEAALTSMPAARSFDMTSLAGMS